MERTSVGGRLDLQYPVKGVPSPNPRNTPHIESWGAAWMHRGEYSIFKKKIFFRGFIQGNVQMNFRYFFPFFLQIAEMEDVILAKNIFIQLTDKGALQKEFANFLAN